MTNDFAKDTPEGRAVMEKYGDILPLSRPEPSPKHPRMSLGSRPRFSALLRPCGALTRNCRRRAPGPGLVPRAGLAEEEQAALSAKLAGLARGQQVTVRYFHADPLCQTDPPLGRYRTVTGTVRGVDWTARVLRLDLEGGHAGPGLEKARGLDVSLDALEAVL